MKKDIFEEYSILVDGLYKGQVSYIFEEMINALKIITRLCFSLSIWKGLWIMYLS